MNPGLRLDLHRDIRSVESVTFILVMVAVVIFMACVAILYFRKVKTQAIIQTRIFNRDIFMNNRFIFERFSRKDMLEPRDFLALGQDQRFMEHLWRKEVAYYEKLVNIIQAFKLLGFLKRGSVLFLIVSSILSYFLITGIFTGRSSF